MKFILFILFVLVVSYSCTKTVTKTNTVTITDTVTKTLTDTVVNYATNNSTLYLLTERQWIPDSVYFNYTGPNTGTLVYVKGGNNNSQDYSGNQLVFWPDGTEDFFTAGSYGLFPWSFASTDSTLLLIINTASDYARIEKLNTTSLTLYDSTNTSLVFYAIKP